MRNALRWTLILFGIILGIGLVGLASLYVLSQQQLDKTYEVSVRPVAIPEGEPELTGFASMMIGFCQECHGPALAGTVWPPEPDGSILAPPNLTPGAGGIGASFTDEDWVRAIRHGIGPDGKSLLVMPSATFNLLSDRDLGLLIAYLKNLPPVANETPETKIGPMARYAILIQDPSLLAASVIDHEAPRPPDAAPGVTVAYGQYLATVCAVCHGEDMAGGGDFSSGVNLTPGGELATWTEADFITTLRTGVTPEGDELDQELMQWQLTNLLSDEELRAIWLYLQSLPALETVPKPTGEA